MSNKNPRKVLGLLDKNAEWIENFAADFVFSHQKKQKTKYRLPIIGFGDVAKIDKKIESLKRNDALPKEHGLLSELLPNAKTVISIFLPFSKNIINNNLSSEHASEEWHLAYSEANKMLAMLIENISKMLKSKGFSSAKIYASHHLSNQLQKRYDICELFSKYSLRHLAEASGIGKFGFNGLLITEYGCNGRIAAIVTDMKIENTPYFNEEYCLAKKGALCYACANACPVNAFDGGRFNRLVCMNERLVKERDYARKHYKVIPRQVCGLCGTGTDFIKVRCAFGIPRKEDEKA
jgi:epoxyqueuosine reductase QueG